METFENNCEEIAAENQCNVQLAALLSQWESSIFLCSAIRAIEIVVESIPKLFNPDFPASLQGEERVIKQGWQGGTFYQEPDLQQYFCYRSNVSDH